MPGPAAEARAAFDVARACFERVSFDLIYARQDQSRAAWAAELREALEMAVDGLEGGAPTEHRIAKPRG